MRIIKKMFKLIRINDEVPDDCQTIAIVFDKNKDEAIEKIIVKEDDFDEIPDKPINDDVIIDKHMSKNPNQCPYCEKVFVSKSNVKRHINNSCPYMKVEKIKQDRGEVNENDDDFKNEIILPQSKIIKCQAPNTSLRDVGYVSAPFGSGKSTYLHELLKQLMDIFPEKSVYLFSAIKDDEDKLFGKMVEDGEITGIDIDDPEIISEPYNCSLLRNSICIFDDYLKFDKKVRNSIEYTIKDIIQNGRDHLENNEDIYCYVTSHKLMDGNRTNYIINEASSTTMFPKSSSVYHIKRYLKEYMGCSPDEIKRILKLKTRFVTAYTRNPNYLLWQRGVMNFRD